MYNYSSYPACMRDSYFAQQQPAMTPSQMPGYTQQAMPGYTPQAMPGMTPQQQYPGMMAPSDQDIDMDMPYLPTGIPAGPPTGDVLNPEQTVLNTEFTQGYLQTQIGKRVKVEFLIGTDMFIDREGILLEVGASYIIIREAGTNDNVLCDMYSIKFVRFYTSPTSF